MKIKQKLIRVFVFYRLYYQWKRLARKIKNSKYSRPDVQSLVIIPCDPLSVGGSRGDEAMLMGVISQYRRYNNIPIHIVCSDENGCQYISNLPVNGVRPVPSWNGAYPIERIYKSIIDSRPTDVVVLGADCMDGFYSPDISLNLLALYDLCNKTPNVNSILLGFSFNENPSKLMVRAFRSLSTDAKIRLRDAVSLARYKRLVNRPAELVADAAFMLEPQYGFKLYDKVKLWVEEQRIQRKKIIGLNFHPMLRCYSGADDIKSDAILLSTFIEKILTRYSDISLILIPHDNRSKLTDNLMLSTMYDYLKNHTSGQCIFYDAEVPRASQLKALCGLLDGLISSRMHLAIAALGMRVPVMAATYQGKFEGLFQHFGLDGTFLLNPQEFLSDTLIDKFNLFINSLPELRQKISRKLPLVLELSNKNLQDE